MKFVYDELIYRVICKYTQHNFSQKDNGMWDHGTLRAKYAQPVENEDSGCFRPFFGLDEETGIHVYIHLSVLRPLQAYSQFEVSSGPPA